MNVGVPHNPSFDAHRPPVGLSLWKSSLFALTLGLLPTLSQTAFAAAPTIEYLEPAGVKRGTETTIKAVGTFAKWPPEVWVDREGLQITPGEKSGELNVSVPAESAPGVYWFRLHDGEGSTPPQPLVVGTLAEAQQAEPNNGPTTAQALVQPVTVNGRLEERGDVDTYAVEAQEGQTLVAVVEAHQTFGSPMDGILQICNADGFVLAQNNDSRGLDPLVAFQVPQTGTYLVRLFAFPEKPNSAIAFSGGANYVYRLTITTQGLLDHALPMAVRAGSGSSSLPGGWNLADATTPLTSVMRDDAAAVLFRPDLAGYLEVPVVAETSMLLGLTKAETPPVVTLPLAASGCLHTAGEEHSVVFSAKKGERVRIVASAHAIGFDLDPMIRMYGTADKLISEKDDFGADQDDVDLIVPIPADGEYRVAVSDAHGHGGARHAYRLLIEPAAADYTVSLAGGEFALQPGKSVQVPVKVERTKDMTANIVVTAADLPAGITAEPVTSEGKGATAKLVNLELKAAAEASSGVFHVHATTEGETPVKRSARFGVKGSTLGMSHVWLNVNSAAK